METRQWYAIQSKPHKEKVVCSQLARVSEFSEHFFPKIRNHRGICPLFPSYLFIKSDLTNPYYFRMLKYTRGVLRIVGTRDNGPVPVDPEAVAIMQERLDNEGFVDQREVFAIGKRVVVKKGPLKDLVGILEKPISEEGRVQILFKLLRYPLRAVLRCGDLAFV